MKKVLIIQGHPDDQSYNFALMNAYIDGLKASNISYDTIIIRDLDFDPNLKYGYRKRCEHEPDLVEAWAKIQACNHIVFFHPVWWGSIPAITKGFFDRLFLPTMAFSKRENSVWWDKHLTGRSARIICTLDQPAWYYYLIYKRPSFHAVKKLTFKFVGISPVKSTTIGPIRLSKDSYRAKYLKKMYQMGLKGR